MSQKLIQTQALTQMQTLSPQQLALAKMLEMPVSELATRVNNELVENAALEEGDDNDKQDDLSLNETEGNDDLDPHGPSGDADVLADYNSLDDVPDYLLKKVDEGRDNAEIPIGESISFIDQLRQQLSEHDLTPHEETLVKYLIGSLDDDGFLRKDLATIADEMAIYHNVSTSERELKAALSVLQEFEPCGIGARNLKECLMLQLQSADYRSPLKELELKVMDVCFDDFVNKRWEKIQKRFKLSDADCERIASDFTHLNPRPGYSLGETTAAIEPTIIPDFIVTAKANGELSVKLNKGDVPEIHVSRSFRELVDAYNKNKDKLSREQQEAYVYTREKVESAINFVETLRLRQKTLLETMLVIVDRQQPFFDEGDESHLLPLRLKDVAQKVGVDISTVSRITNSKYVLTDFGVFPLKFFFNERFVTEDGEEATTRRLKKKIKELIDGEDKNAPLTDTELAAMLQKEGFPVARRTAAKYRETLGYPVARLRK